MKSTLVFFEELSTLINSGTGVVEAVRTMADYLHDPRLRQTVASIKNELSRGNSLSGALARFPMLFPEWQINIIKYSEAGGILKDGLEKVLVQLRNDLAIKRTLLIGLAYPVLLFHIAVVLLPIASCINSGFCSYFTQVVMVLLPVYGVAFGLYGIKKALQIFLTYQHDIAAVYFPLLGRFFKSLCLARFIGVLQALCAAGVDIITGWRIAADSCGNIYLRDLLMQGMPLIKKGGSLSEAFFAAGVFPRKTLSMIAVGEKSGAIDVVLGRIATYAKQERETAVALFLTIVPVVVYIAVAVYIGYRVVSFYSGYFTKILNY